MGHTGTRTTSGNPKRKARPGTSQSAGYPTHGLIFLSQVWLVARFVRVIPCAGATRSGKCLSLKCAGCTSACIICVTCVICVSYICVILMNPWILGSSQAISTYLEASFSLLEAVSLRLGLWRGPGPRNREDTGKEKKR